MALGRTDTTRKDFGSVNNGLFEIKLKFYLKHFVNERNPEEVESNVHFYCSNAREFSNLLWQVVGSFVKKDARHTDGKWEFVGSSEDLSEEDVSRFVLFSQRRAKSCFRLDEMDNKTLFNLSKEPEYLSCYIYVSACFPYLYPLF